MSKSKHHYDHGMVWVPLMDFAREYNKAHTTIQRWIANGFIFTLGCQVKKDPTGHWYIGRRQPKIILDKQSTVGVSSHP